MKQSRVQVQDVSFVFFFWLHHRSFTCRVYLLLANKKGRENLSQQPPHFLEVRGRGADAVRVLLRAYVGSSFPPPLTTIEGLNTHTRNGRGMPRGRALFAS